MLRLKEEYDYLIVDTDEWLQDRAEEVTALSEAAQEWQQADTSPYPQRMLDWVKETFPTATGIYGDGEPFDGCTYNEETEEFGVNGISGIRAFRKEKYK